MNREVSTELLWVNSRGETYNPHTKAHSNIESLGTDCINIVRVTHFIEAAGAELLHDEAGKAYSYVAIVETEI